MPHETEDLSRREEEILELVAAGPLADIGILFLPLTIALLPALVPSRLAPRSEIRS